MTPLRFFRKATLKHNSRLGIIALPDEASAFHAYRLLHYHGISPEHLAIVGKGYSSPARVGLLEPMQIARRTACSMGILAGSLGCVISFIIFLVSSVLLKTPVNLTFVLVIPATGIMAGFCGAVLGALFGFLGEGSTAGIYHHHLHQGHYLLMIEGPEKLVRSAQEVLSHYITPKAR